MLARLVKVERHEVAALAWSFAYFFFLLSGYYVLRPVRDEMGVQSGVTTLPYLFTAIFLTMLAAVPVFGWLASRFPRRTLLPAVYIFFILDLLCFWGAFQVEAARPSVARVFFVWVSVFNLFAVSVFWSFMVDLFSEDQGKRLFGFIAAGGTLGAIAGPALAVALAGPAGPINLLLVSALLLGIAVICVWRLGRSAGAAAPGADRHAGDGALGGGIWAGIVDVLRSPYLLGICFYLFCYTATSTLLYVEMMRMVPAEYPDSGERTRLFATLDLTVNSLTLALQLFVTAKAFERLGVTATLALLPAVSVAGLLVLGAVPLLMVLIVFGVIRRAGEFALSKPAREILFTAVPRAAKYKAKNVIDTVVYRGGDALSSTIAATLRSFGFGLSGLSFLAAPLAVAWLAVAVWLGRRQRVLRASTERRD
jgi:AAA family ATP:ADP antiporter